MKSNRKFVLAALFLMLLAPASFAGPRDKKDKCDPRRDRHCQQQVPEGGSALVYLLGAGITCLGAMVIRSRSLASTQS
jgi:hypothetical protein